LVEQITQLVELAEYLLRGEAWGYLKRREMNALGRLAHDLTNRLCL
jgi:hypothetical protein